MGDFVDASTDLPPETPVSPRHNLSALEANTEKSLVDQPVSPKRRPPAIGTQAIGTNNAHTNPTDQPVSPSHASQATAVSPSSQAISPSRKRPPALGAAANQTGPASPLSPRARSPVTGIKTGFPVSPKGGDCGLEYDHYSPISTVPILSPKHVRLAVHTVTVDRKSGERVAMDTVQSLAHQQRAMSLTSEAKMSAVWGRSGTVCCPSQSLPQEFLFHLRMFANLGFEWHPPNYLSLSAGNIINLFYQVAEVLKKEPRLIRVNSPAYIMGDLHGNIQDLMAFGHSFWRQGANVCPANLVFLGDYVDRRPFSIEVLIYLFSQKLTAPKKVTLLRGNHEFREVNMMMGFMDECDNKFGPVKGPEVWEAANNAFDMLPLAAVIAQAVFCAHGGIPGPDCQRGLAGIDEIPCPLTSDTEYPLVRDLMWSDPQDADTGQDFVANPDRGLSHKFSTRALEAFLFNNQLEYVVRAHQYKVHLGFQVQKGARLVTVFSSSAYCGARNEASCVLVADGKLRMMRLDTLADVSLDRRRQHPLDQQPPTPASVTSVPEDDQLDGEVSPAFMTPLSTPAGEHANEARLLDMVHGVPLHRAEQRIVELTDALAESRKEILELQARLFQQQQQQGSDQ